MKKIVIYSVLFFSFTLKADDTLQYYNLTLDCDRPIGKQITAGGLLVLGSLFFVAGYSASQLSKRIEKEVETTGYYDPYGVYSLLGYFCYALGGVSLSASIVLEIKSIKEWKHYIRCKSR